MRRQILKGLAASALALATLPALAQETVKVGLILPMTGQQASTGRQLEAGVKAYMAQHGNKVAGKTVEGIIKDRLAEHLPCLPVFLYGPGYLLGPPNGHPQ